MSGQVLVTGATGKTGGRLTALLSQAGLPFRAASRSGDTVFDWSRPETWDDALDGVGSVYLVLPPGFDDGAARMIEFLRAAGDRRFVLLGMASLPVGGPGQGLVHEWLRDNSGDWAVLSPSAFMQNFSEGPYLASIREEDTFYSNTGDGRVPFISADDIAQAALAALAAPEPLNGEATLTGDTSMSYDRVAELISEACGRRITHTHISTEAMAQRFMDRGLPERNALFLAFGYQTIAAGVQDRVTPDLRRLTGKAPVTFEAFAQASADRWKRDAGE